MQALQQEGEAEELLGDGEHLAAVPVEHSLGAGAVVGALAATFVLLGARGVSRLRSGRPAMRAGARCHSLSK